MDVPKRSLVTQPRRKLASAPYLKSMKTVAGIRKISLQAMNFRMFCWLAVSLSRKFLMKPRLVGPTDCRDQDTLSETPTRTGSVRPYSNQDRLSKT